MSDSELTLANPRLQMSEEGHPFLMSDAPNDGRPSLEASTPGKAKGIGGTVVGSERPMGGSQPSPASSMAPGQSRPHAVLSPAQMLIAADEMEQNFMNQTHAAENPYGSSLEASIDRPNTATGVPEWLHEYMDKQPFTDPYHQVMPGRVDLLNSNKYLQERDRLKYLKNLREQGKF